MSELYQYFQEYTLLIAFGALLFIAALSLVLVWHRYVFGTVGKGFAILFTLISLVSAIKAYPTAKEKKLDKIIFLQNDSEEIFLYDQGSYVSNNIVHLHYATRLLPDTAQLYLDCIPKSEPPDSLSYSNVLSGTVATLPEIVEFEFENAISNRWVFYTTYTPGPAVHTNGVAIVEFIRAARSLNVAVPKRTTIWEGGLMVYPNAELLKHSGEGTSTIETED